MARTKKTLEKFVYDSRLRWGDTFDYTKTVYSGTSHHLTITCRKHNLDVRLTPNQHLHQGRGCPKCRKEERETIEAVTAGKAELYAIERQVRSLAAVSGQSHAEVLRQLVRLFK